jgi:hypothetical protein
MIHPPAMAAEKSHLVLYATVGLIVAVIVWVLSKALKNCADAVLEFFGLWKGRKGHDRKHHHQEEEQ